MERDLKEEDLVTVKCRCKSCGNKFTIQIRPNWELDSEEEKKEIELDASCPKCQSSEIEVLEQ